MITLLVVVFFSLLLIGHPIGFCLGLTSLVLLVVDGSLPLNAVPQYMFMGLDSFPLMAIPFFILAGEIMVETGISRRLVDFAMVLLGRIPGALAQVSIATCVFFAGVTGAAVADAAAVGSVLIPAMKKEGYPATYATALVAAASAIGPIIPPSIILVVYGVAASTFDREPPHRRGRPRPAHGAGVGCHGPRPGQAAPLPPAGGHALRGRDSGVLLASAAGPDDARDHRGGDRVRDLHPDGGRVCGRGLQRLSWVLDPHLAAQADSRHLPTGRGRHRDGAFHHCCRQTLLRSRGHVRHPSPGDHHGLVTIP